MEIILIADDLTGANVTGAAITRAGMHGITLVDPSRCTKEHCERYDAVLCSSDSRSLPREAAYGRVREAIGLLRQYRPALWINRIDSTLRGNLGASTDAFLDYLDRDIMAIVVPAMPTGNRKVREGLLYLNDRPLHESDVARDPKAPVYTSCVQALFARQTQYTIRSVFLKDIRKGIDALAARIQAEHRDKTRVLILDAEQTGDIERITDAVLKSGVPFVAVDPGDFSSTLARRLINRKQLLLIGSVNHVTRLQVDELLRHHEIHISFLSVDKLCRGREAQEQELRRVYAEVAGASSTHPQCVAVLDSIYPENRIDFAERAALLGMDIEGVSLYINDALAELAGELLTAKLGFRQLFSCGGDITFAICRKLHSSGIEILHEVMPLIMHGRLIDGDYPGLEIITKGGMVGDPNAVLDCINYLKRAQ